MAIKLRLKQLLDKANTDKREIGLPGALFLFKSEELLVKRSKWKQNKRLTDRQQEKEKITSLDWRRFLAFSECRISLRAFSYIPQETISKCNSVHGNEVL